MTAKWNEGAPAVANQISADIPDINESLNFLALWAKERRSVFTYNGGTTAYTIKCKSAYYYCKDKVCWWDAELITGAIGTPVKDDWYYLYLDHSAITSGTEITNAELLWSSTEPAWNTTYAGWYNGDDRCIFAARTDSTPSNILEFFHDGDFVLPANQITDYGPTDISTDWSDECTFTVPVFVRKINVTFFYNYVDAIRTAYWRTEGQIGITGHVIGRVDGGMHEKHYFNTDVICSSNLKIDMKDSGAATNTLQVYTAAWYLPIGM